MKIIKKLFPIEQAQCDVEKYGGCIDDYIKIHEIIDSVRTCSSELSDLVTHNSMFISCDGPIGRIFGKLTTNNIPVQEIAENHIIREYGKVLIPQDIIQHMEFADWMQNGQGHPPSHAKIHERRIRKMKEAIYAKNDK